MRFFNKSKNPGPDRETALQCHPLKNPVVREKRLESGNVILTPPPISMRPWMARILTPLRGKPSKNFKEPMIFPKKIELDALGTMVWDLVDGHRSVAGIIEVFATTHAVTHEDAETAVTIFLKKLGKRGLIGIGAPSSIDDRDTD